MMPDWKTPVTKIQRFSTHDGPGLRTTVFFKGCPLRCQWCHNPETQSPRPEIFCTARFCIGCGACAEVCPQGAHQLNDAGHTFAAKKCAGCLRCTEICPAAACEACAKDMSTEEILTEVLRDAAFFGEAGGMTLSGGEPLFHPEAALCLLRAAKEKGLHTALETCGFFEEKWLRPLTECTDLFLWDFKDSDSARHKRYTGVSNERILQNLACLDELGGRTRLRCILVRGVNMEEAHYEAIAAQFHALRHCEGVDLEPYHPYGSSKAVQLGLADNSRPEWIPTPDDLRFICAFLAERGVPVGE